MHGVHKMHTVHKDLIKEEPEMDRNKQRRVTAKEWLYLETLWKKESQRRGGKLSSAEFVKYIKSSKLVDDNIKLSDRTIRRRFAANENKCGLRPEVGKCGHEIHPGITMYLAKCYNTDATPDICLTCMTAEKCRNEQVLRDQALHLVMDIMQNTVSVAWPDEGRKVVLPDGTEIQSVVQLEMNVLPHHCRNLPKKFVADRGTVKFMCREKKFRNLSLQTKSLSYKEQQKILGGRHPPTTTFQHRTRQILRVPGDGSIGFLAFPTYQTETLSKYDYAFMSETGLSNESIMDASKNEMHEMTMLPMRKRGGQAGGVFQPSTEREFDPKYLTDCAKHNREFYFTGGKTTASKCAYVNPNSGKIKVFGGVYNDICMNDVSPKAKRKELMRLKLTQKKSSLHGVALKQ